MVAFFFLLLHFFLYINKSFPIRNYNRNVSKWGKLERKPYHPCGFRNQFKLINQWRQPKFECSWIAFCRKAKTKAETSVLRNPKIMPSNLNKIVLAWIPSLYTCVCICQRHDSQVLQHKPRCKDQDTLVHAALTPRNSPESEEQFKESVKSKDHAPSLRWNSWAST